MKNAYECWTDRRLPVIMWDIENNYFSELGIDGARDEWNGIVVQLGSYTWIANVVWCWQHCNE
jgi:hypothetical protein